jgi:hypothetical protein
MKYLIARLKLLLNLLISTFIFYFFLVKKNKGELSTGLDLVVFSKDRPFQLKSYLLSVLINVKGINSITVLYTSTSDDIHNRYATLLLLNCFKDVHFVQQKKSFKIELISILDKINSNYMMFAVDDMLVFDKIDTKNIILNLKEKSIFSMRLGRNIKYSYTLNKPQTLPDNYHNDKLTGFISWKVKDGIADFSYPMSVDMHIFPSILIKNLSKWLMYTAPNSYEGALSLSSLFIGNWDLVSFHYSKCINLPLNKVQDENNNRSEDDTSIDRFMVDFDNGYCFDPNSINKEFVSSPHQVLAIKKIKCQELNI